MNIYTKNEIFTIELVDKNEIEAMKRIVGGKPSGSLVTDDFTFTMCFAILRKIKEGSGQ